jgi:hypothetical protein
MVEKRYIVHSIVDDDGVDEKIYVTIRVSILPFLRPANILVMRKKKMTKLMKVRCGQF